MPPHLATSVMPATPYPGGLGGVLPEDSAAERSFDGLPRILVIVGAAIGLLAPLVMMCAAYFWLYREWHIDSGSLIVQGPSSFGGLGPVRLEATTTGVVALGGFALVGVLALLKLRFAPIVAFIVGAELFVHGLVQWLTVDLPSDWIWSLSVISRYVVPAIPLLAGASVGLMRNYLAYGLVVPGSTGGEPVAVGAPALARAQDVVQSNPTGPIDGMAFASFVLSLLGQLGFRLVLFGLISVAGVALAHVSYARIKRTPGLGGRDLALAGIVLGWVTIVLWIGAAIVWAGEHLLPTP